MTTGDYLQRGAAQFPKFPQQLAQPRGAQLVASRVGDDRQSAGLANPAHCLLQCRPLARYMARLALDQITFEYLLEIPRMALFHQITGKMGTAHQIAVGIAAGTVIGPVDTGFGQTPADLLGAPAAKRQLPGNAGLQGGMPGIDVQTHNMQGLMRPTDRQLDPGNQPKALFMRRKPGRFEAGRRIVVGQRQVVNVSLGGSGDQFGRTQCAVGGGGMGV